MTSAAPMKTGMASLVTFSQGENGTTTASSEAALAIQSPFCYSELKHHGGVSRARTAQVEYLNETLELGLKNLILPRVGTWAQYTQDFVGLW